MLLIPPLEGVKTSHLAFVMEHLGLHDGYAPAVYFLGVYLNCRP